MTEPSTPAPSQEPDFDLGYMVGQRRALSALAGRCTAAHAEILRRIRDEKLFLPHASSWLEYCGPKMKISRRHADRLIALLKEFGPVYFELAELVGITAEQYRLIAPCVRDHTLHAGGEAISLIPSNSEEINTAVHRLLNERSRKPRRAAPSVAEKIIALDREGLTLIAKFESLMNSRISLHHRGQLLEAVDMLRIRLGSLKFS